MSGKTFGECTDLELLVGAIENMRYLHEISKRSNEENLYTHQNGQVTDWRDLAYYQASAALTVLQIRLEDEWVCRVCNRTNRKSGCPCGMDVKEESK